MEHYRDDIRSAVESLKQTTPTPETDENGLLWETPRGGNPSHAALHFDKSGEAMWVYVRTNHKFYENMFGFTIRLSAEVVLVDKRGENLFKEVVIPRKVFSFPDNQPRAQAFLNNLGKHKARIREAYRDAVEEAERIAQVRMEYIEE